MGRKAELIQLFKEYKSGYETAQKQITDAQGNQMLTDEGKQQLIEQIISGFAPTAQFYHDKAMNIIETGIEALKAIWDSEILSKLTNAGYQTGLLNVVKMLELGSLVSKDNIQPIINFYAKDFNAISMIKELTKSKTYSIELEFPKDTRVETTRLLQQLRDNVDQMINVNILSTVAKAVDITGLGSSAVLLSMDSMSEFVNDRLDDNLQVVN